MNVLIYHFTVWETDVLITGDFFFSTKEVLWAWIKMLIWIELNFYILSIDVSYKTHGLIQSTCYYKLKLGTLQIGL